MLYLNKHKIFNMMAIITLVLFASKGYSQDWLDLLQKGTEILKWGKVAYVILASDDDLETYLNSSVNTKLSYGSQILESSWLTEIGQNLVSHCDRPILPSSLRYKFLIIGSTDYNAFAVPGGTIYVTKPLYDLLDRDEMAFVLGHEIGHVIRKHGVQSAKSSNSFLALKEIGRRALKKDRRTEEMLDALVSSTFTLIQAGYSRDWERDVDDYSVKLCKKTGYRPEGGITALQKLGNATQSWGQACFLWNTHPSLAERINLIRKEIGPASTTTYTGENHRSSTSSLGPFADFSSFPESTVSTNCVKLEGAGWDNNPVYKKSIRLLGKGSRLEFSFDLNEVKNPATLFIEHLSSLSQNCPSNGYSPITITINGMVVCSDYSPRSHGMATDQWNVFNYLKVGRNEMVIKAGDMCSHYWLRKWSITM